MGIREFAEAFARKKLSRVPMFGFEHIERVRSNAAGISPGMGHDPEVLELAILLHDCGVGQWFQYRQDHVKTSVAFAKKLLEAQNYPQEKADAVLHCIREHHFDGGPKSPEAEILHDADLLDNIGAIGIMHDCYAAAVEALPEARLIEYMKTVSASLPEAFSIPRCRLLAEARIGYYKKFTALLEKEASKSGI